VEGEHIHKQVNLVQYRRLGDHWQFVPVLRKNGKLKRKAVGSSPRGALDAWHLQVGIRGGDVEQEPEPELAESKTIDAAIAEYLRDVKATNGTATHRSYTRDLSWFRQHCTKRLVSRLNRPDAMSLFAAGREDGLDQKTTNKRVVVMLTAMRSAGAEIELRKGD